ncbi:hypothetical protein LTS15_010027 [Exophiala xenobiotica]|nr:hypothetical protein LTS15_010027 [Exophiala xenobiotica]
MSLNKSSLPAPQNAASDDGVAHSNPDVQFTLKPTKTSADKTPVLCPTIIKQNEPPDGYKGDVETGVCFCYCFRCNKIWAVVWKDKPRVSGASLSLEDYKKVAKKEVCDDCMDVAVEEVHMAHEGYVRVECEESEEWELL